MENRGKQWIVRRLYDTHPENKSAVITDPEVLTKDNSVTKFVILSKLSRQALTDKLSAAGLIEGTEQPPNFYANGHQRPGYKPLLREVEVLESSTDEWPTRIQYEDVNCQPVIKPDALRLGVIYNEQ